MRNQRIPENKCRKSKNKLVKSPNRYEKMISGMYLGEITRHILRRLVNERILLQGNMPEKWNDMDSIPTSLLSDIARLVDLAGSL